MPLRLFVLKPEADEPARHPVVDAIRATPRVPARHDVALRCRCPLAAAQPPAVPARAPARRAPPPPRPGPRRGAAPAAQAVRARRTPLSGPRKIYLKELLQAVALADRLLDAPRRAPPARPLRPRHDDVTWLAATITGLPFSFTGHAKDIYAERAQPGRAAAPQAAGRRASPSPAPRPTVAHLRRARARGRRPRRLPRPERRLRAPRRADAASPPRPTARCASSASAGWCRRRASTSSSTRAPSSAARGRRLRGADRRRGRRARRRRPRRGSTALGLDGRVALLGPAGPGRACSREYRRATVFAWPAGCSTTATATASRTCSSRRWRAGAPVVTTAVSGIPELVATGRTACSSPPDDPRALADALVPPPRGPRAGRPPRRRTAARTVARALRRRPRSPARLAALFRGGAT